MKAADLHLGDTVRVLSLNLKGTVSTLPDAKGNLFVQMGILRSQVKLSDLELVEEAVITAKQFQKTSAGKIKMSKSASVSTEINLIGMTVDEALAAPGQIPGRRLPGPPSLCAHRTRQGHRSPPEGRSGTL